MIATRSALRDFLIRQIDRQPVDQRRFSRAGRPGNADDVGCPGFWIEFIQRRKPGFVLVFHQGQQAGERQAAAIGSFFGKVHQKPTADRARI